MSAALRGLARAAALAWTIASGASAMAQEPGSAPTGAVRTPPAFDVDRTQGPLAFDLAFKLADHDNARLHVSFTEIDGEKSHGEHTIFGLDFQPFEGARFTLSRSTKLTPLVSGALSQVPEPKELDFKLHVELPQEGGLAVTLPDGFPVVVALTPHASKMRVEFAASGGVLSFTATKAERVTKLRVDAAAEPALAKLIGHEDTTSSKSERTLGPALAGDAAAAPPLKQVRSVDVRDAAGGVIERNLVEFEDGVESPFIVARPKGGAKLPLLLIIAGEDAGISSATVRAAFAAGIAAGRLVAAIEPIGTGERRSVMPHDELHVPELELVGLSSNDLATTEARQVLDWLRKRNDIDPARVSIAGVGVGVGIVSRIQAAEHAQSRSVAVEALAAVARADLPVELVRVGDDYLRLRFDSSQLQRALQRRDELPAPDDSVPFRDRVIQPWQGTVGSLGMKTVVFTPGLPPVRWISSETAPSFSKHVTIVASDRGMRVALEEAAARLPARDDETFVALDPSQIRFVCPDADSVDVENFFGHLGAARGPGAEPPRILADGTTALSLLVSLIRFKTSITASDVKFPIASFTASHALASFEILLRRPYEAHRCDASLEVLTQGMPEWVFVPNALTRFEIEDVVLALKARGLAIDWQDPVDMLRRPLSRHDRLAMWPRVRHADFVKR